MNITRRWNHFHTAAEFLRRGLLPILKTSRAQHPFVYVSSFLSPPVLPYPQTRSAIFKAVKPPDDGVRQRDEGIQSDFVQIVCDDTNKLLPPERLSSVLRRIDRTTYFLVEVAKPGAECPYAVCKILEKRAFRKLEQDRAKPVKSKHTMMKELEVNWIIGDNDFRHKMDKLERFLAEGRRVMVTLGKRRKGRNALPEEAQRLLAKVKSYLQGIDGAKEYKEAEGGLDSKMKLFVERRGMKKGDEGEEQEDAEEGEEGEEGEKGEARTEAQPSFKSPKGSSKKKLKKKLPRNQRWDETHS